jgi:hypothetical protein
MVKRGVIPLLCFLLSLISLHASAAVVQYQVLIQAPADLSVKIGAPSTISPGAAFLVTANITNRGSEDATGVIAELIFLDRDNDEAHSRKAFTYNEPVKSIGNLGGGRYRMLSWSVRSGREERLIGNYSILVRSRGVADISGDTLLMEEKKPISIPGFDGWITLAGFSLLVFFVGRYPRGPS